MITIHDVNYRCSYFCKELNKDTDTAGLQHEPKHHLTIFRKVNHNLDVLDIHEDLYL